VDHSSPIKIAHNCEHQQYNKYTICFIIEKEAKQ
jgi:hypothetical protein